MYVNHTRKRQWVDADQELEPEPKGDLHPRKVMLSVWWDVHGIIMFELLPPNVSITAACCCEQLEMLSQKSSSARPGDSKILFLHDNARPHTAKATRLKLLELGWEILPHPPYSLDLAPSDCHLFRALQNQLADKKFDDRNGVEIWLHQFFQSQKPEFFHEGMQGGSE